MRTAAAADEFSPSRNLIQSGSDVGLVSFSPRRPTCVSGWLLHGKPRPRPNLCAYSVINSKAGRVAPISKGY